MADGTSHDDMQLLLPVFALGQLHDEDDRFALAEHLATCESCQLELEQIEQTVAAIQGSAPLVEPPADLRNRILGHPAVAATPRDLLAALAVDTGAGATDADVVPITTARARRWFVPASRSLGMPAMAAACLVLALVVAGLGVKVHDLQGQRNDLQAAGRDARAQASTLAAPVVATKEVSVHTTGPLSTAHSAVALTSSSTAVVVVKDLPSPGTGHSWQAWAIDSGDGPVSIGVLENAAPMAVLRVRLPKGSSAIAFTLEPSGGSTKPTTSPVGYGTFV